MQFMTQTDFQGRPPKGVQKAVRKAILAREKAAQRAAKHLQPVDEGKLVFITSEAEWAEIASRRKAQAVKQPDDRHERAEREGSREVRALRVASLVKLRCPQCEDGRELCEDGRELCEDGRELCDACVQKILDFLGF